MGGSYPLATLKWNVGSHNFMAYTMGGIPAGVYDPNRLAGFGVGHWVIGGGFGYTYANANASGSTTIVGLGVGLVLVSVLLGGRHSDGPKTTSGILT